VLIERFITVLKRWFEEHVASRKFENIMKEIMVKVDILNTFLIVGAV